jgi:hypothetical protein
MGLFGLWGIVSGRRLTVELFDPPDHQQARARETGGYGASSGVKIDIENEMIQIQMRRATI